MGSQLYWHFVPVIEVVNFVLICVIPKGGRFDEIDGRRTCWAV